MRIKGSFRQYLYLVMKVYDGEAATPIISLYVDFLILFCIIVSSILVPISYLFPQYDAVFHYVEIGFTVLFIIEYLLRWYAAKNRLVYPFTLFALLDFIAILPTLLINANLLALRMFRLVRLIRLIEMIPLLDVLKHFHQGYFIYRRVVGFRIWANTFAEQYNIKDLSRLLVVCVLAWIIGANVLFFTETRLSDVPGPYSEYWRSYWHIIIVLISGIEDKEPLTLLGRIEVTVLMVVGICVVGMVTGEIVSILVRNIQQLGKIRSKPPRALLRQHIVIIGNNSHFDYIVHQLNAALHGLHYILVVANNISQVRVTNTKIYKNVMAIDGNPLRDDILLDLNLKDAYRVIILADSRRGDDARTCDSLTMMKTIAAVGQRSDIPMVVELQDTESLLDVGALPNVEFLVASRFCERMISQAVLNPGSTYVYNILMNFKGESSEFYTIPLRIISQSVWRKGFRAVQLFFLFQKEEPMIPVGLYRNGVFYINPLADERFAAQENMALMENDELVVIAYQIPSFLFSSAASRQEDFWDGRWFSFDMHSLRDSPQAGIVSVSEIVEVIEENDETNRARELIIICNCNEKIKEIIKELRTEKNGCGLDINLIIPHKQLWDEHPHWHPQDDKENSLNIIYGRPTDRDILVQAEIEIASKAIILADPAYGPLVDSRSALIGLMIESINPGIHTVMELLCSENRLHLMRHEINEIVCVGDIAEKLISQSCITPGIIQIFDSLLTTREGTPQIFTFNVREWMIGMTFGQLSYRCIEKNLPFICIGFIKRTLMESNICSATLHKKKFNNMAMQYCINPVTARTPERETILEKLDQVIFIGHSRKVLSKHLDEELK